MSHLPTPPAGMPGGYDWRALRLSRGWSQMKVICLLETAAAAQGVSIPGRPVLKTQLSRWENGRGGVSAFYTELLCRVFDLRYGHEVRIRRDRCHNSRVFTRVLSADWSTWASQGPSIRQAVAA